MNLKNCIVNKVTTLKDRSIKIELLTREMPPKEMAELFFSVNNEIASVDIPEDTGDLKTPSQRLRAVLYRVWETDENKKSKFSTFTLYYNHVMEQLIDKYKEYILET